MQPLQHFSLNKKMQLGSNSNEKYQKLLAALTKYVYTQTNIAMLASLFCASIIFLALFKTARDNSFLFIWATLFLIITISRAAISTAYIIKKYPATAINFWRNLYVFGALLGGASWGFIGIFLLPQATPVQQMLMVLMLAGVTAGAVPLSAAIPSAAIAFLVFSILPFIISIALLKNYTYLLFDMALSIYLIYMIILTIKAYKLITHSITLQFENDLLIHNLEASNKKLEQAATHDPLTQIANRRLFEYNLETAISLARNQKKILALLYIDLDDFKLANDRYGHNIGDYILMTIVERLKKHLRKDSMIARLGGDELAVIIENAANKNDIETVALKICQLIAMPIETHGHTINISASIGISIYPYDGQDEESLLRCADQCMYHAKENGGNSFHFSKGLKEFGLL